VAAQIKLINGSTRVIKIGDPVKLHATKKNSFDYANLGDIMIGTSAQQTSPGGWCFITLLGNVQWNDIIGKPLINGLTQSEKSKLDNIPVFTISNIAPSNPSVDDIWIDSSQN
jgi:hypothetical protein